MPEDCHTRTSHKWTLDLHQALIRDVVSLTTSDVPGLEAVGVLLKDSQGKSDFFLQRLQK
jgi:hypothetical protein